MSAIEQDIKEAKVLTKDMGGSSGTSDIGDEIARIIREN